MIIVAGVLFLFSVALLFSDWGREAVRPGFMFLAIALLFGLSAYGLATKRRWATHLSLILTATMASELALEPSLLRSTVFPIFWLMILAVPAVAYSEIVRLRAWVTRRRQQV